MRVDFSEQQFWCLLDPGCGKKQDYGILNYFCDNYLVVQSDGARVNPFSPRKCTINRLFKSHAKTSCSQWKCYQLIFEWTIFAV